MISKHNSLCFKKVTEKRFTTYLWSEVENHICEEVSDNFLSLFNQILDRKYCKSSSETNYLTYLIMPLFCTHWKKPDKWRIIEKSWNFLWLLCHFCPSQMNFGKIQGLYDIPFLNFHIKCSRFGSSKLGHNFFVFQFFVSSRVIFAIKSCQIKWLNILIDNLEICWRKTEWFLEMEKMPKIVLPISLQIDNSIDWNLLQNQPRWYLFSSY